MHNSKANSVGSIQASGRGFTLIELLVVIAVLALLAALLIPSFHGMQKHAREVICRNNLKELAELLHADTDGDGVLPAANSWFSYIVSLNGGESLVCPEDDQEMDLEEHDDMADLYIVQNANLFSNLQDVITLGRSLEDNQILVNPPGIAGDHGWNPPDPASHQTLVCIDDDAAFFVSMGDSTIIESIDPPGDGGLCGSEHWICTDDGSANWRSSLTAALQSVGNTSKSAMQTADPRVLMRLTGRRYAGIIEPPYTVGTQRASYGMSTAVDRQSPRPGQLLLAEYDTSVIRLRGNFTDLDESLRPRHFGRANYISTDGNVSSKSVEELEQQLHGSSNMGIWGP
jgi:prepilin-type N-terminal cleavage/methylation domain-containing protein